jgi:hypothetical protein
MTNQDNDYIVEGIAPQESTTMIEFSPFPNDSKFHSISATKYLTSGKLLFMISDMVKHENGSGTGFGKALEITSENKQEFETFVQNLYNLTFNKELTE